MSFVRSAMDPLFPPTSGESGPLLAASDFGSQFGLLPREKIELMARRGMISSPEIEEAQFQPASLDLRLGARAYRVRASFLPGNEHSVRERLDALRSGDDEISLEGNGAVLERGCVYVIPLLEHLNLPDSIISAIANPKSSTGRLDIFTRLITDNSDVFDRVARGYEGPLYAEVSPRSFSVRVRKGSKLNQIRFRRLNSQQLEGSDFGIKEKDLRERHEKTRSSMAIWNCGGAGSCCGLAWAPNRPTGSSATRRKNTPIFSMWSAPTTILPIIGWRLGRGGTKG